MRKHKGRHKGHKGDTGQKKHKSHKREKSQRKEKLGKSGSARVFEYTVYRGFLNQVYGIFQLKYGYWVYHVFFNFRYKVYLPFLSLLLHIPKRMNLDRFMLFKNKAQLKVLIRVKKTMKGDNGDVYMTLLISWL